MCLYYAVGMFVDLQTDTHYAILSLLLLLANSPTNAEFQPPTADKLTGMVVTVQQKSVFCRLT